MRVRPPRVVLGGWVPSDPPSSGDLWEVERVLTGVRDEDVHYASGKHPDREIEAGTGNVEPQDIEGTPNWAKQDGAEKPSGAPTAPQPCSLSIQVLGSTSLRLRHSWNCSEARTPPSAYRTRRR